MEIITLTREQYRQDLTECAAEAVRKAIKEVQPEDSPLIDTAEAMEMLNYTDPKGFRAYLKRHGIDAQVTAGKKLYNKRQLLLYPKKRTA